jgi:hypothetical protein
MIFQHKTSLQNSIDGINAVKALLTENICFKLSFFCCQRKQTPQRQTRDYYWSEQTEEWTWRWKFIIRKINHQSWILYKYASPTSFEFFNDKRFLSINLLIKINFCSSDLIEPSKAMCLAGLKTYFWNANVTWSGLQSLINYNL